MQGLVLQQLPSVAIHRHTPTISLTMPHATILESATAIDARCVVGCHKQRAHRLGRWESSPMDFNLEGHEVGLVYLCC